MKPTLLALNSRLPGLISFRVVMKSHMRAHVHAHAVWHDNKRRRRQSGPGCPPGRGRPYEPARKHAAIVPRSRAHTR